MDNNKKKDILEAVKICPLKSYNNILDKYKKDIENDPSLVLELEYARREYKSKGLKNAIKGLKNSPNKRYVVVGERRHINGISNPWYLAEVFKKKITKFHEDLLEQRTISHSDKSSKKIHVLTEFMNNCINNNLVISNIMEYFVKDKEENEIPCVDYISGNGKTFLTQVSYRVITLTEKEEFYMVAPFCLGIHEYFKEKWVDKTGIQKAALIEDDVECVKRNEYVDRIGSNAFDKYITPKNRLKAVTKPHNNLQE